MTNSEEEEEHHPEGIEVEMDGAIVQLLTMYHQFQVAPADTPQEQVAFNDFTHELWSMVRSAVNTSEETAVALFGNAIRVAYIILAKCTETLADVSGEDVEVGTMLQQFALGLMEIRELLNNEDGEQS